MPAPWYLYIGRMTTPGTPPGWSFGHQHSIPLPQVLVAPRSGRAGYSRTEVQPSLWEFLRVSVNSDVALRGPGHTCAGHVQRVQVCSVVAIAADAIGGPF